MIRKHVPAPPFTFPPATEQVHQRRARLVRPHLPQPRKMKRLRLFNVRPISVAWQGAGRSPAFKTLVANTAYIWRDGLVTDRRFGRMPPSFAERRAELRTYGLSLPASAPVWTTSPYAVWDAVDSAVDTMNDNMSVRGWHIVSTLPSSLSDWAWKLLVETFVEKQFVRRGAPVAWAVHALLGDEGKWIVQPHAHMIVPARRYRTTQAGQVGDRMVNWAGSRRQQDALRRAWETMVGPLLSDTD
ncbi:MobA/MobL family protein [Sphingomonas sp. CGMCC 1.13654]|uniref:MobA/MobL family protein n=1 Tax=Sphingomonas chungangi TaxID=2683589 RepID=A0A838L671_9SPHN|nr:MobA/MobL family protein [Sphingomonas chungangi]MBA2933078.1 MobA/MobL family protein [Sphingomonas chungangi]